MALAQTFPPTDVNSALSYSRAVQAVLWGMSAVNTDLMLGQMLEKTPGRVNQFIYWGRPLDWRNQTLTPNPDTLYFMLFFDTRGTGPMVLEIPPAGDDGSLTGNIVTVWQTALEDVGVLGIDQGRGGRFVIMPPGCAEKLASGFTPLHSDTHTGYALLRVNMKSHAEADVAAAVAYGRRVRFYPYSMRNRPTTNDYVDVKNVEYDSTIRYDLSFFRSLHRIVQTEPWIERDRAMIDPLRTIGIEKGKPFEPDPALERTLAAAIRDARALLDHRYDQGFPPYYPGSHWMLPTLQEAMDGQGTVYADHDRYAIDARAVLYTYGYIAIKRLGTAQFYLLSTRDRDGLPLNGARTYRLNVPANVPVTQYWSVTAYDRETHALIKGMKHASRSSQVSDLQKNADGSVDIYFGPTAPPGKQSNWVPTDRKRDFELLFRLYGPQKQFFERSWVLADLESVA